MQFGILFPGQGAQDVGMGLDFVHNSPSAKALFDEADSVLGLPLSKLCFEGPLEELTATDIAQPAIYTCSLAALAAFEELAGERIQPIMAAGLSLGEYTALAAAGAISFADGLRLVRLRGSAMQAASEAMPSGMTSVMAMEREPLEALCAEVAAESAAICQVANLNSPGQLVVSGQIAALDLLESRAKDAGAKRAIRLNVAGAFHSEVMRPASEKLEAALSEIEFQPASCPVWQNATAEASTDATTLKANLVAQLCSPVLWQESFAKMVESAPETTFLEPAPGRVLSALARKIARGAKVVSLHEAAAAAEILESIR
ncbi:MAG: ACP S-malonyltransferase [Planctomycetes bacterium]|nr:ACP S-malonyltransferase [Planctomycetota bacterium]MCP4770826.1 ACP S-malonyltransferase [Planctomycetota bacterium]MCP4860220.1 ACP S-malonyltransferase [Planctomycetota bacterium]